MFRLSFPFICPSIQLMHDVLPFFFFYTANDFSQSGSTAKSFVDMIQRLDNRVKSSGEGDYGKGAEKEQTTLEQESRREIDGVVEWCLQEFGTGRVFDATTCWVKPNEKVKQAGQDQTTGEGSGLREF